MFTFGIEGLIFAIIAFAGLIFIHELGHFIGARIAGIGVEAFALGFGPPIFKFKHKGVEYRLNWILFGGYCKMKGQEDFGKDEPSTDPDDYHQRPSWARLVAISAGPLFNLIIGAIIFGIFLMAYGEGTYFGMPRPVYYDTTIAVHSSFKENNPDFPFQTGDTILSINGWETQSNLDVIRTITYYIEEECDFEVMRDGERTHIFYKPSMGFLNPGIHSYWVFSKEAGFIIDKEKKLDAKDREIYPKSFSFPADEAQLYKDGAFMGTGLQNNDIIIGTKDGATITTIVDLRRTINKTLDIDHPYDAIAKALRMATLAETQAIDPIHFIIKRGDETLEAVITPKYVRLQSGYIDGPIIGVLQKIQASDTPKRYNIFEGLIYGAQDGWYYLVLNLKLARLMFTGHVSAQDSLAGPIGIFSALITLGERSSFMTFLWWVALISLLLGFFNLLPIPALDGGHILVTLLEMIRRKRFKVETIYRIQTIGFIILLGIMLFATFNDIRRLVFGI